MQPPPEKPIPPDAATQSSEAEVVVDTEAKGKRAARLGPLAVMQSVAAAFFGVQSERNRTRDFANGRASTFVIAGLVATLTFIAVVWTVVSLVLRNVAG